MKPIGLALALSVVPFLAAALPAADEPVPTLEQLQALLRQDQPEAALRGFEQLISRDKACAACYLGRGEAEFQIGLLREARSSLDRALKLGLATPAQNARAHDLKALVLNREVGARPEGLKKVEAELRLALAADPTDPTAALHLGTVMLRQGRDAEGVAQLEALLARQPDAATAASARQLIANPRRAREAYAPDFEAVLADGRTVSLEGLRGKVVLIDFWATWCGPCRDAIPELKELVRMHGERGLVVLSISVDEDEAAWRRFLQKNGMTWLQCRDGQHELSRRFDVHSFPTYIVLDGEGVIRHRLGGTDPQWSLKARLRKTLETMPELASR
jgi:thioredoxin-like negative regulator of GroEL